ncbi:signal peptide peptidase-domain-containing protein [Rhypophila decipiens]|uniref:Signal peptide peptidase-domain-containing protein n=1 Tax=Rhypophila decipiens TaxID=261697 RepID=A0AAN6YGQ4_9PEZI|nr:signal peptide peptidase-domain-containing protein [Rhypophila decipiens]
MSADNITTNITQDASNSTSAAPRVFSYDMLLRPEFLLIEAQVIFSALSIIWLGSHASLRRPPSAAPPRTKKGKRKPKPDQYAEGLSASDAIMLPIMAGIVLMGLYYLIEWLQDPDVLNKFLRVYLSLASIASLGKLSGDFLDLLTSLVFPDVWADRSGIIYHIDSQRRCQLLCDGDDVETGTPVEGKVSPFPGPLSGLRPPVRVNKLLWEIRHLFTEEWKVRLAIHGVFSGETSLKLNSLFGFCVSMLVTLVYYLTGWNIFSNLLGSAFSYAALTLMSPTSFGIGTMVLVGLFVYDIVMVFYTGKGASMLGLGDIVIPGLLMGLALRFDLYRHYQKKIKREPVELSSEVAVDGSSEAVTVTNTETQYKTIKAPFTDPKGQWGNKFWTSKFGSLSPVATSISAATFSKPYFYATVAGYALGMIVTLAMLLVFQHGQPALLYLVPGVTGSVWLTALLRGELRDMWNYTENGSLDTEDVVVEVDEKTGETKEVVAKKETKEDGETKAVVKKPAAGGEDDHDVFLFAITAPKEAPITSHVAGSIHLGQPDRRSDAGRATLGPGRRLRRIRRGGGRRE